MKKNSNKTIEIETEIRDRGNWNYKNSGLAPVYTKPMGIVTLDKDEFVWKHEEILKLIKLYYECDIKAIEMIQTGEAGEIKNFEAPFLKKLRDFLNKLEEKRFA